MAMAVKPLFLISFIFGLTFFIGIISSPWDLPVGLKGEIFMGWIN